MAVTREWTTEVEKTWCPGCGNFGVLAALRGALKASGLEPWQVVVVAGIGQAGKTAHYLGANYLHGLHGRTLAHALGVKLANHRLKVVAIAGDGDIYGEGGSHLMMMFRRNPAIACFVHNNGVYGLTKGQPSPTSERAGPWAAQEPASMPAFNPLAAGLAMGGTFLARGFAGNQTHLTALMGQALRHEGFGFVDILQPCVTYDRQHTFDWYRERVYDLGAEKYDPTNREQAFRRALEWPNPDSEEGRIPVGVFFQARRQTLEQGFPVLRDRALTEVRTSPAALRDALGELE
jgi:2-oxoglutarate ferredoxin oxidoreductase subunit beta